MKKIRSPIAVMFLALFFTGTAINVENSGNTVDTLQEAKDRIVADVKEGYSHKINTSFELND